MDRQLSWYNKGVEECRLTHRTHILGCHYWSSVNLSHSGGGVPVHSTSGGVGAESRKRISTRMTARSGHSTRLEGMEPGAQEPPRSSLQKLCSKWYPKWVTHWFQLRNRLYISHLEHAVSHRQCCSSPGVPG